MNGILQNRSLGLKLFLIGIIVVMLGVPIGLISVLSWERQARADQVVREVGASVGGEQTIRGPFLVLPYETTVEQRRYRNGQQIVEESTETGVLVLSADRLDYDAEQDVVLRRRSIFEVPVHSTRIQMVAGFRIPARIELLPDNSRLLLDDAELVVGLTDLRSVSEALTVRINGADPVGFEPGSRFDSQVWRGVTARLPELRTETPIEIIASTRISGAGNLRFVPSGRETRLELRSDWPHPGFQGAFLPNHREISELGHTANWQVPYLARSVPAIWDISSRHPATLDPFAFGVDLVTPADGYQQVGRSLKYALFFLGFVLLMFFLVEARLGQRVHPAQYVLAGMAQVIFYLLLLALSEHTSMALAYLVATGATVGLSGFYAVSVFGHTRFGLMLAGAMGFVYLTQYVLILMEDYALLVGAFFAFIGLASVMVLTRDMDWYARTDTPDKTPPTNT